MLAIIMAGGSGTRLWPQSRQNYPKQFLSLLGRESFLQMTAKRMKEIAGRDNVFVVTGGQYKFHVESDLTQIMPGREGKGFENMILEPSGRNTAPAIALSIKYALEHLKLSEEEVLFFTPSDHIIQPEPELKKAIDESLGFVDEALITFGITPTRPETGFGYIQLGKSGEGEDANMHVVERFVEKPDKKTAEKYLKEKSYAWNSGMFMFSIKTALAAFKEHAPEFHKAITEWSYEKMIQRYRDLPAQSIDYALMEKADNIICKKLDLKWNDIGSWESVYELLPKDDEKNVTQGRVDTLDVKNSLILSKSTLTTVIGLENVAVIETDDAVLVCDRRRSQDVRQMVSKMKKANRKEAIDHTTTFRPWGSYTVLENGERYKIKRIVVNPGERLSLQRHRHRSEHWVVIKGMAEVEIGKERLYLHENESAYVPVFEMHRLINPGRIPLEMIEVQNGEYVGEDDIERFDDVYGREDQSNTRDRGPSPERRDDRREERREPRDRDDKRRDQGRDRDKRDNKSRDGYRKQGRKDERR